MATGIYIYTTVQNIWLVSYISGIKEGDDEQYYFNTFSTHVIGSLFESMCFDEVYPSRFTHLLKV